MSEDKSEVCDCGSAALSSGLCVDCLGHEALDAMLSGLRRQVGRYREELERFGVRFVDDDEVIGVYWLPAPKGQPVAGSLREALEARAEELRAGVERLREENEALSRGLADMNDGCVKLEADVGALFLALRNVRALAKRLRKTDPENAAHFLRFCDDAGVRDDFARLEGWMLERWTP